MCLCLSDEANGGGGGYNGKRITFSFFQCKRCTYRYPYPYFTSLYVYALVFQHPSEEDFLQQITISTHERAISEWSEQDIYRQRNEKEIHNSHAYVYICLYMCCSTREYVKYNEFISLSKGFHEMTAIFFFVCHSIFLFLLYSSQRLHSKSCQHITAVVTAGSYDTMCI